MSSLKGENQAAAFVNEFYPNSKLGVFQNRRSGFEFYSHQPSIQIDLNKWANGFGRDRIFYIDDVVYQDMISKKFQFKILKEFDDHTSENVLKFIKAKDQSLHKAYLIKAEQ
jgi:hypothetical protein